MKIISGKVPHIFLHARVRFNFWAICLIVHWPSEFGPLQAPPPPLLPPPLRDGRGEDMWKGVQIAPMVALQRPGRRRPSTGRRPEAPDLSRPGTRKNVPHFETHPLDGFVPSLERFSFFARRVSKQANGVGSAPTPFKISFVSFPEHPITNIAVPSLLC